MIFCRKRNMTGVRIMWNKGKPLSFDKKWNPFAKRIPWITFANHPLYWHKGTKIVVPQLLSAVLKIRSLNTSYLFQVQMRRYRDSMPMPFTRLWLAHCPSPVVSSNNLWLLRIIWDSVRWYTTGILLDFSKFVGKSAFKFN